MYVKGLIVVHSYYKILSKGWTEWSNWSTCKALREGQTCGGEGFQKTSRRCRGGPRHCPRNQGGPEKVRPCNLDPCGEVLGRKHDCFSIL